MEGGGGGGDMVCPSIEPWTLVARYDLAKMFMLSTQVLPGSLNSFGELIRS